MIQKPISSFEIFIYGGYGNGHTTLINSTLTHDIYRKVELSSAITITDLAQILEFESDKLSKLCNKINLQKPIRYNLKVHIKNNLISDSFQKYISLISEHKNGIIVYLTPRFDKIRGRITQYRLIRIRGDTLCFNI